MSRLKSVCAVMLAALMVIACLPTATVSAEDAGASVTIGSESIGDISAIKDAILEGFVGSGDAEDYEFYYEYSFDNLTKSSIFTPSFVLDGEEVEGFFGEDTISAASINKIANDGYDKLHEKFLEFAKTSTICKNLAVLNEVTTDEFVNAVFAEGSEGKSKLQEVMEATYWTPIQGYENINDDYDSNLTTSDCVAYIPYTINGTEHEKSFGIALPEISVGTWNVRVINKDTNEMVSGTVTIEGKTPELSVDDGAVVSASGVSGIVSADCDNLTIYSKAVIADSETSDVSEAELNELDVYVMLPAYLDEFKITASYGSENFGTSFHENIAKYIEENLMDKLAESSTKFESVKVTVDELPSENGIYYVTVLATDRDYETAMKTGVFVINDGTAAAEITFNTEAVDDVLQVTDDLGAGNADYNYYIGKDLEGEGNGEEYVSAEMDKLIDSATSDTNKARLENAKESLLGGELPENTAEVVSEFIELYAPADDDYTATAFLGELLSELSGNSFDLNDYGIYNDEEDIKAIGFGTYLQIAKNDEALAVPAVRVFELNGEFQIDKTDEVMKTMDELQITATGVPSGLSVVWSSSNTKVATVDQNGLVTAKTYGKCVITAALSDGSEELTCDISTLYYDVAGSSVKGDSDYLYYFTPVYWAADNGITKGYNNVFFGPDRDCTRAEFAIFLWRLSGCPTGYGDARNTFSDVSAYSTTTDTNKAIAWAAAEGIVKGYSDGTFGPDNSIRRIEAMIMLYRLDGQPSVSGTCTFADVNQMGYKTTSDSYKSVVWGTKNKITAGYSDGTFQPMATTQREHMITFIYRYAQNVMK